MTADEVAAFLDAGRTMTVSSRMPDDTTHLAAMWYAVEAGVPEFWTYASAQKALNLRRDPRITALVETGETYDELAGVMLVGRAELVSDHDEVGRIGLHVMARYGGDAATAQGIAPVAAKRVGFRLHAGKVVSWDHRKLAGGY